MVIEIKQLPPKLKEKQADLNKRINGALKAVMTQIETKKYYKELVAHRIERIIMLPIIFVGKSLFWQPVEKLERDKGAVRWVKQ